MQPAGSGKSSRLGGYPSDDVPPDRVREWGDLFGVNR